VTGWVATAGTVAPELRSCRAAIMVAAPAQPIGLSICA